MTKKWLLAALCWSPLIPWLWKAANNQYQPKVIQHILHPYNKLSPYLGWMTENSEGQTTVKEMGTWFVSVWYAPHSIPSHQINFTDPFVQSHLHASAPGLIETWTRRHQNWERVLVKHAANCKPHSIIACHLLRFSGNDKQWDWRCHNCHILHSLKKKKCHRLIIMSLYFFVMRCMPHPHPALSSGFLLLTKNVQHSFKSSSLSRRRGEQGLSNY